jgi:glutathione S-transferase
MSNLYRLHYAPDNASLCVRMICDHLGLAYDTVLVERSTKAQQSQDYLALNPNGKIPAFETPDGPMFETAAILLWLADRHGALVPAQDDPARGATLKWLFNLSNTMHPMLRNLFYPKDYLDEPDHQAALRKGTRRKLRAYLATLDYAAANDPAFADLSILDFYLVPMLRWLAIYPTGGYPWFKLGDYPALSALAVRLEALDCTTNAATAEGLGAQPFTAPHPPNPPEGTAT